jgi:hypothetical protein
MQASLNRIEDDWREILDNKTLESLSHDNKQATWLSVVYGHPDIQDEVLVRFAEHLGLSDGDIFSLAAVAANVNLLDKIAENNPDDLKHFILKDNFTVFRSVVSDKHFGVMMRLMEHLRACAPEEEQNMIAAGEYYAFRVLAENNQLSMMNDVIARVAPDRLQEMIGSRNYFAFIAAAGLGHLDVMNRLIELAEPETLKNMIEADDYAAFKDALEHEHEHEHDNDNDAVVNRLLSLPLMFAYAEMNYVNYKKRIARFVDYRILDMKLTRGEFEQEIDEPETVIDMVNPEEAKLCFYMCRNLIRRYEICASWLEGSEVTALLDPVVREKMARTMLVLECLFEFLIDIPSVQALLHTEVTPNQPNELLRLALRNFVVNNRTEFMARTLFEIPAVHELAQQNDFYIDEVRSGLNLTALTQDRESSMTALTPGEERRLAKAIEIYQPMINQRGGVSTVMQALRNTLEARYKAHPACIRTGDGRDINLPFFWDEWQTLSATLSADTCDRSLKAYYQHKDHTAFRYLSKPNPWMHDDASYVEQDAESACAWSTFEEYQSLIAMFYLGAGDENIPPCDGHTFETRLEHFIDALAHIGRAHNWDGMDLSEEYDDLNGDKPSCYLGVKRRLFYSVLGHPLFKVLTLDDIKHELRGYVYEHFKRRISEEPQHAIAWKQAWDKVCETGQGDERLSEMNIPEANQNAFIESLSLKYPLQFDEDQNFTTYIQSRFALNDQATTHAAHFGGEVDLISLFNSCVDDKAQGQKVLAEARLHSGAYAMFKPAQPTTSHSENDDVLEKKRKRCDYL